MLLNNQPVKKSITRVGYFVQNNRTIVWFQTLRCEKEIKLYQNGFEWESYGCITGVVFQKSNIVQNNPPVTKLPFPDSNLLSKLNFKRIRKATFCIIKVYGQWIKYAKSKLSPSFWHHDGIHNEKQRTFSEKSPAGKY